MKNRNYLSRLPKQSLSSLCLPATLAIVTCLIFTGNGLAQALPIWAGSFTDVNTQQQYQFGMVGTDPSQTNSTTKIPVYLIPVSVTFASTDGSSACGQGSVTFDAKNTTLWDNETLVNNVLASPIFVGVNFPEGNGLQYIDAFQRGNFWYYVSQPAHSNYHLQLGNPTVTVLTQLTFPAPVSLVNGEAVDGNPRDIDTGYGGCVGAAGANYLVSQFSSLLGSQEVQQLPGGSLVIFLTYDVFLGGSGSCNPCSWEPIGGGVHGGTPVIGGGSQTWAWATYNGGLQDASHKGYCDSGGSPVTCSFQDVADLSHEVGEWADDPYGHTPAPCEGVLEVGDPLNSRNYYHIYPGANNNYPYHLQDLVFLSYFGATNPNLAYHGQTTFRGENISCGD